MRNKRGYALICLSRFNRKRVIGGNRHKGSAEYCVRSGGKNPQRITARRQGKINFQAAGAADPVTLHGLDRVRPARQIVQFLKQFVGIGGDTNKPLRDFAFFDHRAGAPAFAIDNLLVGQHRLIDRIPVDHGVLAVGQAFFHKPGKEPLLPAVVLGPAGGNLA